MQANETGTKGADRSFSYSRALFHFGRTEALVREGKPDEAVAYAVDRFTGTHEARLLLRLMASAQQPEHLLIQVAELGMGLVGKGGGDPVTLASDLAFTHSVQAHFPGHPESDIGFRAAQASFAMEPSAGDYQWYKALAGGRWPEFRDRAIAHAIERKGVVATVDILTADHDQVRAVEVYGDGSQATDEVLLRMFDKFSAELPNWLATAAGDRIEAHVRRGDGESLHKAFSVLVQSLRRLSEHHRFWEAMGLADRVHGLPELTPLYRRRVSGWKEWVEDEERKALGPSMR